MGQCNHKGTYKIEAGKSEKRRDEEAEIGVTCFEYGEGATVQGCKKPLEAGKARKWILPGIHRKEHSPANAFLLAWSHLSQVSAPQNWEINLCCVSH